MKKTLCIILIVLALITTACTSGATPIKRSAHIPVEESPSESGEDESEPETDKASEDISEATSAEPEEDESEPETDEVSEDISETASGVSPEGNYKDSLKKEVESKAEEISKSTEELITLMGDSYDGYVQSEENIAGWYAFILEESGNLYDSIKEQNISHYKAIVENIRSDDSYDWEDDMDDIYKAWDNAMDDCYDEWDDLYDDVYDKWDYAISKDDSIDYSTSSEAWSKAYTTHSDAWNAQYSAHSDAWSEIYRNHSAVWSGLFSGETDIDKLIEEAGKSTVSEDDTKTEAMESDEPFKATDEADDESGSKLPDDLIRDEIKEAIDSYEGFVDEYCEFMENYDASDFSALAKYTGLISKEAEMGKKFEAIEDMELTEAEALYYSEVSIRCSQKMLNAASSIN